MKALQGIEAYVLGLLEEVYHDLTHAHGSIKRTSLEAKKQAYKDVLQYIKEGRGIL